MASAIGWYGPLIDLSRAELHIGDFVQLLVFVHRCNPVQYKLAKGGEVLRTDIQVGDDSTPFFTVSLWQKQMAAIAAAGDVVLLQNVKITKFGRFVEATTVQFSSLVRLIYPYETLTSKGVDDLISESRAGDSTKDKLVKVINWVQRIGSSLCGIRSNSLQHFFHLYVKGKHSCTKKYYVNELRLASTEYIHKEQLSSVTGKWKLDELSMQKKQLPRNWKLPDQSEPLDFFLLSEVLVLNKSCKAIFNASVGEIFLPITWRALGDSEKETMFVSRRIETLEGSSLVEDFTCIGCQSCGSPSSSENGSIHKQIAASYFCPKTSDHQHILGLIYRPFMLYVWDETEFVPLLVRNKAAEILFGNLKAERVCSSYKSGPEKINYSMIWLILVKMLLQKGKSSPLRFEVEVNPSVDVENGKFEMVSMSIPCINTINNT